MEEKELKEKKSSSFGKKEKIILAINVGALAILIAAGIFITNFRGAAGKEKEEETVAVDFSGVTKICELSTLKCYYHNVAELIDNKGKIFNYGFKKLWLEYTGTIEVGIDANQVQVNNPDENNVVYVYVPNASIKSVNADANSMSDPVSDTGLFTKITTDDQNTAFTQAQQEMLEKSEGDATILNRAKNNAKKLIESYIVNVGKQIGETYTVNWLEEPKSTTDQTENETER